MTCSLSLNASHLNAERRILIAGTKTCETDHSLLHVLVKGLVNGDLETRHSKGSRINSSSVELAQASEPHHTGCTTICCSCYCCCCSPDIPLLVHRNIPKPHGKPALCSYINNDFVGPVELTLFPPLLWSTSRHFCVFSSQGVTMCGNKVVCLW